MLMTINVETINILLYYLLQFGTYAKFDIMNSTRKMEQITIATKTK